MRKQSQATFQFKPFSRKQRQVLHWWTKNSPVKEYDGIIADGAIRSGKSLCMSLSFVMWAMSSFNGQNFGMCGKTVGSFRRNVLFWLKMMMYGRGYRYEDHRADNLIVVHKGNVENYFYIFGGLDERSQDIIQGITLAGVFLDEVALMPESFVNQATGRCSVDGSKMWFNCNPSYPSHWFKEEWIDKRESKNLLYLHFTMEDNLSLSEKIKARYKAMYAGVFFKRYILGLWAMAEGLVYPMYEDALEDAPEDDASAYCLSIDYGTMNAFAALLWEKHGAVWYATRNYYYSGRDKGITKTDEEYAKDLDAFLEDITPDRPIETIIDPSAASFIALLKKRMIDKYTHRYKVIPAKNDVMDGIRETATALQLGYFKISPSLADWIKEAEGYVWDEREDDKPIKINDHCLTGDTLVMTKEGEKRIDSLIGTSGEVWSYNTDTGKAELKPHHDCRMTQESAEIYEIETEDGRVIRCTGEHPILTDEGYVMAKDLKESDRIVSIGC